MQFTEYLKFTIATARQAGKILQQVTKEKRVARTKSTELDLVTCADKMSEDFIISAIRKRFPAHRILSEEESGSSPNSLISWSPDTLTWVVDPLDGTTNYSHSFPFYCVSIGLTLNGQPVLGVVYNPNLDEMFYAIKGKGAYCSLAVRPEGKLSARGGSAFGGQPTTRSGFSLREPVRVRGVVGPYGPHYNNRKISVSRTRQLSKGLLVTGFPYIIRQKPGDNFRNFQRFCMKAQAIRRAGAAALDLCYVASGIFDGFWERELKPWDTAAGTLIVTEAGGKVTNFKGKPYNIFSDRSILASNGRVHTQMIKVINGK
ncbi:MAG: inositol monophosphatase [Planctomycetes bacterium]|nr:inositol monophosphatase [Planctomycetota bacterium]